MIKITKPGQKEFHGFCKWCGCEFTYEISDLKLSATSDKVSCPTCGKDYYHPSMVQDPTIPGGIGRLQAWPPEPIPTIGPNSTSTDPCAGCAWKENLSNGGIYVGDTPCTWCRKNQFNCLAATQPSLKEYTTPVINYPEANLEGCSCGPNAVCNKCSTSGTITALSASARNSGGLNSSSKTIVKDTDLRTPTISTCANAV
jgi:hypothetical protein